jgi:hypothetical protein
VRELSELARGTVPTKKTTMNPTNRTLARLASLCAATAALGACHRPPKPDSKAATLATFTSGMTSYLKARGDLCLDKQFPIDVSEREVLLGSRNALQMPALEHAGLVTSTDTMGELKTEDGVEPIKVRRYRLTDVGQRYYLSRPALGEIGSNGQPIVHSDLCALKLSLDKVVGFELAPGSEATSAVVSYTYKVEPAPWLGSLEIQQVFPAVTRVLKGASSAQLKEGFTLTPSGWIANELVSQGGGAVANR